MEGVETKRSSAAGAGDGETGTRKKGRVTLPRGRACVACRQVLPMVIVVLQLTW
jgi:hypothetical protein